MEISFFSILEENSWFTSDKIHLIYVKGDHGLPQRLSGKESACNAGVIRDVGSIPGWGRSPGGGHGNPLQYSCLENPLDRGAWRATVHGVTESQARLKQLSMHKSDHGFVNF